jgi:hypothetical protein
MSIFLTPLLSIHNCYKHEYWTKMVTALADVDISLSRIASNIYDVGHQKNDLRNKNSNFCFEPQLSAGNRTCVELV